MKNAGRYIFILIAVIILWNTAVLKPLRIFSVYLHELVHTLMAFMFGYGIKEFKVNFNESGYAIVQSKGWFSSFMIANGGYLGSVFFALLILYLKRTSLKKFILGTLAVLFLIISAKYSGLSFALWYSIFFAAIVFGLYIANNERVNEWVIDIIGISSVAYAIYDIIVDTIILQLNSRFHIIKGWGGSQPLTDAVQLARMTHIPAIVWGIIWLVIALVSVNAVLLKTSRSSRKR